ncbi:alpha/beta fold hydrolase [Dyadobacter sandarakinus]|uniref:Alpha/beta hydrolase n=1 Tax=Dyadobacter sandarakinus TaxID=2747268 RepID=A0ABX7I9P3_9BACT|nr:alpha/beta hydrolase [Dyadobacter sandarakinus]QRR02500.1 alpha/beta hydrolase [Dyadobacter sandarakinus]
MVPVKFRYEYQYVNGIMLHVGHLGPDTGEKIFFLHGFPEFSQAWIKQAQFFAEKGYHVIVPDQRGYNLSRKPLHIKDYQLKILVNDIVALIVSVTADPVVIVAHDWGGGVAWVLAQNHPGLIKKLIILNMPHLQVMKNNLRKNPKQMLKSWYAVFFQLGIIPERLCGLFNYKALELAMVKTARPGTFPRDYISALKKSWKQPNGLSGMINWYRAYFRFPVHTGAEIIVPVLLLWGAKDTALSAVMAEQSIGKCRNGKLIVFETATHWLHHEEPEKVSHAIYDFLNG